MKHSSGFFSPILGLLSLSVLWISPSLAEKVVLIGDSLSDNVKFGKGLAQAMSQNGSTTCSFTASNSNLKAWTEGNFSGCCTKGYGAHALFFQNGSPMRGRNPQNLQNPLPSWSASSILSPTGHLCPPAGQEVDRLLIQLGTNLPHSKTYIHNLIQTACKAKVKNIHFILPPQERGKRTESEIRNRVMIDSINSAPGCPPLSVSYFPSATWVPISDNDFKWGTEKDPDHTHFWNTESETHWLNTVLWWRDQGFPKLSLKNSPENPLSSPSYQGSPGSPAARGP